MSNLNPNMNISNKNGKNLDNSNLKNNENSNFNVNYFRKLKNKDLNFRN